MFSVLRNRVYRRLYTAQIVALLGTGLATVALGLLAYDLAGERAGQVLGSALAIKMVAYVAVSPAAGFLASRFSRKTILISADTTRFLAALSLPFVTEVWQVLVLIFLLQSASAIFTPTFQSTIPDVVPDQENYTAALSLSRLAYDLEAIVSPMLAAALLLVASSQTLFLGTAAGFIASALLVTSVLIPRPATGPTDEAQQPRRRPSNASMFWKRPALRPILAVNFAVAAAGAFIIVQTVVVVRSVLGLDQAAVAWMLGANGLGSMMTALLLPRMLRTRPERRIVVGGLWLMTGSLGAVGAILAVVKPTPSNLGAGVATLAVLWFTAGAGVSMAATPLARLIRANVSDQELPGAFAAQFSLSHACWLVTYPLVGWLGATNLPGAALTMTIFGLLGTVAAIRIWPKAAGSTEATTETSGQRSARIEA